MKNKKEIPAGLMLKGRLKRFGVTFYPKQGQTIMRPSKSKQPRRNGRGIFVSRQKTRHATALWQMLTYCHPMFSGGKSAYHRFLSLAHSLPPVFIPCKGKLTGASLLMPDMPVSEGTLLPVKQWLGEVAGTAALVTNLKADSLLAREKLMLYTVVQQVESGCPRARMRADEVERNRFVEVDGCLALVDEVFADEMKGWALVRVDGERCSTQSLVTRCRYYEQYTTEEALLAAAATYGGLT